MVRLRKQIALGLVMSGRSLEDVMEEILYKRPKVHNEFIGGFFQRLGAAWRGFWHGDDDESDCSSIEQAMEQQRYNYETKIGQLTAKMKKGGMDDEEIRAALYALMQEVGGQHYDMMTAIREKRIAAGGYKDGGIMMQTIETLGKLQALTQDPRIKEKERVEGIEAVEKQLTQLRQQAEQLTKTSTDDAEKKEAQAAIQHIDNPELKKIIAGLERLKTQLREKLNRSAPATGEETSDGTGGPGAGGNVMKATDVMSAAAEAEAIGNKSGPAAATAAAWNWYQGLDATKKAEVDTALTKAPTGGLELVIALRKHAKRTP